MSFIRLLLYGILIYVVLKVFRVFVYIVRSTATAVQKPEKRQEDMVRDEVCDTYIPRGEALRMVRDGREYYFCSEECRRLFVEGRTSSSKDQRTLPGNH